MTAQTLKQILDDVARMDWRHDGKKMYNIYHKEHNGKKWITKKTQVSGDFKAHAINKFYKNKCISLHVKIEQV